LVTWHKLTRAAAWGNFAALKQTFGSADQVGNCVVFDAGNNRYRVIGRVNFTRGIVYVLKAMDHEEYDRKLWVGQCACHKPPPKKASPTQKSGPRGRKGGK
jgi:mRNA interferase HigB